MSTKDFLLSQISSLKATLRKWEIERKATKEEYARLNYELMQAQSRNRELEQELEVTRGMVIRDPLTEVASRIAICDQIDHHFHLLERGEHHVASGTLPNANEQHFSILFLDLDNFKPINDTYGHEAGDAVLIAFARFLKGYFNRGSDIVSRYAGDEFMILLSGVTPKEKADRIKEKFLDAMDGFEVAVTNSDGDEVLVPVTCSVGVSSTSDGHKNSKELKHAADLDMYTHKESRKAAR